MSDNPEEGGGWGWDIAGAIHTGLDLANGPIGKSIPAVSKAMGPLAPAMNFLGPVGVGMGLHDVLQGVEHGDVTEGLRGGLEMVSGVATTAEALGAAGMMGEVAAVTGAAATGLGIGSGMAHLADDDDLGRSPLYGHNDATGKDNTALDVSTHAASWVDDAVGGGVLGSIAGGTTAALGAMTMAPLGAETAAINWAANLLK